MTQMVFQMIRTLLEGFMAQKGVHSSTNLCVENGIFSANRLHMDQRFDSDTGVNDLLAYQNDFLNDYAVFF